MQVSSDNINWTTVQNVVNNPGGGIKTYDGLNTTGRYVRMYGTTRTTGYGYSLFDFQVWGTPQADTNLALNQPATASSVNGGNTAALAFDNDPTTRWESQQGIDPQWLAVDLGSVANIHKIVLNWENAAGQNYQLQVSNDNINWTTIQNVVNNPGGGIKTYDGLTATGRYVRMYGTTRTTAYGYSLFDFQVWGSPVSGGGVNLPAITSPTSASGTVGVAFSYQITASQNPTSFGATGLPDGLTIDTTAGTITGTPTTAGTSSVTISASNASGSGSAMLALTINPNGQIGQQPRAQSTGDGLVRQRRQYGSPRV